MKLWGNEYSRKKWTYWKCENLKQIVVKKGINKAQTMTENALNIPLIVYLIYYQYTQLEFRYSQQQHKKMKLLMNYLIISNLTGRRAWITNGVKTYFIHGRLFQILNVWGIPSVVFLGAKVLWSVAIYTLFLSAKPNRSICSKSDFPNMHTYMTRNEYLLTCSLQLKTFPVHWSRHLQDIDYLDS